MAEQVPAVTGRRAHDPARGLRECSRRRTSPGGDGAGPCEGSEAAFASAVDALAAPHLIAPVLDLFGEPVDPRRGMVGRPRHTPGDRQRAKVAELHDAGLSHDEIAAAMGITAPTLRLNYPLELNSRSQVWRRRIDRDGGAQ